MGSGESTPSVHYTDNSSQINQSLDSIRSQINNLNNDLKLYQSQVDSHVNTVTSNFDLVQQKFVCFDENFRLIQTEFEESFKIVHNGIKILNNDIDQMAKLQISFEQNNSREHWEIFQNDWKESFRQHVVENFQKLQNMKFALELDLHKQIGSYLLIKTKFNDKLKLYQETKSRYQIEMIDNKLKWFIKRTLESGVPTIRDMREFETIGETNSNLRNILTKLESEIQFPPELDPTVEQMYLMTNKFEEILQTELNLKQNINEMMSNYSNSNLLNPLDNIIVTPSDFAKKLYVSGVNSVEQIAIAFQNTLLVKNGYAYVPDYKYKDLIKKFVKGCEEANLLLNWKLEKIEWLSQYLYSKSTLKSLSDMIEHMKHSTSIYQLNDDILQNKEFVANFGLELWKGLNEKHKLDLSNESNPLILYNVFVFNKITLLDKKSIELSKYLVPSDFAIENINKIIFNLDNQTGLNIFTQNDIECDQNSLVNHVVAEYIKKSRLEENFKLKLDFTNVTSETFFNEIVIGLLNSYNKIIWDRYVLSENIYVNLSHDLINLICSSDITKFDHLVVDSCWKQNSTKKLKLFVGFCFQQIYNFYWNK